MIPDNLHKEIPVMVENFDSVNNLFIVSYKKYIKETLPQKVSDLSFGQKYTGTLTNNPYDFGVFVEFQNYYTGLFTFGDGEANNLAYTVGLSRNNTFNDPIYPIGGSSFSLSAKFSLPYSLISDIDYTEPKNERDAQVDLISQYSNSSSQSELDIRNAASERIGEIDQLRYKWLEFYKVKFKGEWYTKIVGQLVLKPTFEFGFLGAYNNDRGVIPFERFFLGGDGLGQYSLDGREAIALRGYPNQSLSSQDGGSIYNKFSLELKNYIQKSNPICAQKAFKPLNGKGLLLPTKKGSLKPL